MNTEPNGSADQPQPDVTLSRRGVLKGLSVAAAAATATAIGADASAQTVAPVSDLPAEKNPYGGGPNTGLTLPP